MSTLKVLHITTSSKGGAGIAALRLHEALRSQGISSAFLATDLTIGFDGKQQEDTFFKYQRPNLLKRIANKVRRAIRLTHAEIAQKEIDSVKAKLQYETLSLPYSKHQLHLHPLVQAADIVNLHWTGIILDYEHFFGHCQKPIVWTLHDMNPFQGIFHYKDDEIRNAEYIGQLDEAVKTFKRQIMKNVEVGAIVAPSKWMLSEANKSGFFDHFEKIHIPNSVDLTLFKMQDKRVLREQYGIDENDLVILFISGSLDNARKGLDLLMAALPMLEETGINLLTIGKGPVNVPESLKVIPLGAIKEASKMAECYALADAFVLPSREDNLPNVMLESFACGVPVISFFTGGMKEHIVEGKTGSFAKSMDAAALANTIDRFNEQRASFIAADIRAYAEQNFNAARQAMAYIELYDILEKKNV
ncbi:glycosyltransferase [Sungkyunkwania multivorans]|uniref:Glycosyltransferase n=1 Tax=Sungkyunkwania multivorans TaxID=1173618 RepID=A0ABW3D2P6_9FLAO